jgi:antitoxin (DNA-binding transcriptional repressor) of toxin-antitoxin stability system
LTPELVLSTQNVPTKTGAGMPHDNHAPPARVGVREFRENMTRFLRQARQGTSFLITSHDEVVAEIRPPPQAQRSPRQPGALRGKIRMAADFDTLPADVLAAMEGEGE